MRKEDLLNYIGSVNDRYIEELFEDEVKAMPKSSGHKSWRALAASLAVIVVGSAAMFFGLGKADIGTTDIDGHTTKLPMAANTVVMLDVNPSIRLEVNDRNVVVEVDAVNSDAEKITSDISIVGKKYDEAVKVTVNAMQKNGYLTELKNSVLVTVVDSDEERAASVRKTAVDTIVKIDKSVDYDISILSQTMTGDGDLRELAEKNHVTTGRIMLIEKICKLNSEFSVDKLVKNNIQTINQLLTYIGVPETVERIGEAAGVVPEKICSSIKFDEMSGDELINFTCALSDFYTRLTDYYSENDVVKQIGYVLKITQGKSADGKTLWGIIAESRNHDIGSQGAVFDSGDTKVINWYDQHDIYKVSKFVKGLLDKAA